MMKIVSIGDSLTNFGFNKNGWATKLILTGNYSIENVGFNGITSTEMVNKLPTLQIKNDIKNSDLVTIWLGTNDVLQYYDQKITPDNYVKNIFLIIDYIQDINPRVPILLIGLPISSFSVNQYVSKEQSLLYEFNQKLLQFSNKSGIPIINLMDNSDGQEILVTDLYDGIHFNSNGHNKLFNKLIKYFS